MQLAPRSREELAAAIHFHDSSRIRAWLDQFSSFGERYAALRALAEPCGYSADRECDLIRWAAEQVEQALGLHECALLVGGVRGGPQALP